MMYFKRRVLLAIFLVGILFALVLPLAVTATAVPVDGLWQQFLFRAAGAPAEACQSFCFPSPSGNSEYAGDPPWEFTAPEIGATLTVVDAAASGDVFEVYDSGTFIGSTSPSAIGVQCGFDPVVCLDNPAISSGEFVLGPGAHAITIVPSASPYNAGMAYFKVTSGGSPVLAVEIDIKPGSDPNSINCRNEQEMIAVAVLRTAGFDAADIDHSTVSFEGASESHVDVNSGQPLRHAEDVDNDGDIDLVFHFRFGETALTCNSIEGTLAGETWEGTAVEGSASVRMVDPGGS
jgi:hypothetical protein